MIDPAYQQSIAINWYFLMVSCVILTITGTILVEKVLVKRFPISKEQLAQFDFGDEKRVFTPAENKGLKMAGIATLILAIVVVLMSVPVFGPTAILADAAGSITASASPFSKGIVFTVTLFLFVPGLFYGIGTGKYKNDKDVWKDISAGFAEMGNYVFMCFFISIFTNFFSVSKIGTIVAIKGAEFLEGIGLVGIPLCLGLIVLTGLINLLIGSASAKWAILAPIFVPLMMLLGYDPAFAQIVYRIGDSLTNPLSPLYTYLPIVLSFARKYDKNVGIGTIIANMIPFSASFAVVWIAQLIIWYTLNLPLGPGGVIFLQ